MKNSRTQGSALVVMAIIVSAIMIGVLGYLIWSNFVAPKDEAMTWQVTESESSAEETKSIPDMITYETFISIENSEDTDRLTNAPESFKKYLIESLASDNAKIKADYPDCFRVFQVSKIYKQRYAAGQIMGGCSSSNGGGAAAALWAFSGGEWVVVGVTQNIGIACEKLEIYKVPSAIAGDTCFTSDPAYPEGKPYTQT
jgi:hypothetical protein